METKDVPKKVIVTGITGQTGSYLCELLLEKGYQVHGIYRPTSTGSFDRIQHLLDADPEHKNLLMHEGDLTDGSCWFSLLQEIQPDMIFNLAAQSHVASSAKMCATTIDVNALGPIRILEAIRILGMSSKVKLYQASSSEETGGIPGTAPQDEDTPLHPRSIYGCSKLLAHAATVNYRESYGIFAVATICYNHESPRRTPTFVTRKTTMAVARIKHGLQKELFLGEIESLRDWLHARDVARAQLMVMEAKEPQDYIVASGQTYTVREFVTRAFLAAGLPIEWEGKGLHEVAKLKETGEVVVRIDPKLFRPAEVYLLQGNSSKIRRELGWAPKVSFDELIQEMVDHDLQLAEKEKREKQT